MQKIKNARAILGIDEETYLQEAAIVPASQVKWKWKWKRPAR